MISLKKKRLILSSLNKKGSITYVGLILTTVIASVLVSSLVNWYIDTNKKVKDLSKENRFVSAFYDFGNNIKNTDYSKIKSQEGTTNTEDLGDFTLTKSYGNEGIFKNGKCDTSVSEDELIHSSQKCISVNYSVKDKKGNVRSANIVRHSTQVDAVPIGTITYFSGDFSKIPSGWHLCDGSNGTPDLRNVFIMGTTNQESIGQISGENEYVLKNENLPNTSILVRSSTTKIFDQGTGRYGSFVPPAGVKLEGEVPVSFCDVGGGATVYTHYVNAHINISDWKGQPIEKQPPYYKLAYIMRIK